MLQQNLQSIHDKSKEMLHMSHDLRLHLRVAANLCDRSYLKALESTMQVLTEKAHTGHFGSDRRQGDDCGTGREIQFSYQVKKVWFNFIKNGTLRRFSRSS